MIASQPRWSIRDFPLLAEALVTVAAYRMLLWIVSLQRLRTQIERMPLRSRKGAIDPFRIGRAVTSAGHRIPRADCLPRALSTQYLLRRRGIESRFCMGVAHDPTGAFTAHAWIVCGDQIVVGEVADSNFNELKKAG